MFAPSVKLNRKKFTTGEAILIFNCYSLDFDATGITTREEHKKEKDWNNKEQTFQRIVALRNSEDVFQRELTIRW
jgi:hypothetical protein